MKGMPTRRTGRSGLALVGVLAVLGIGSVAIPTVASAVAPAGPADADYRPSAWAPASDAASSGKAPSLTNHVGMPGNGSDSELWLGYALLGVSLLVLAGGLAARATQRRRPAAPPRAPANNPQRAHVAAGVGVRR